MTLSEYLDKEELTGTEFAQQLNRTPGTVSRWLNGTRMPRPADMLRIEKLTKGKVTWHDFATVRVA